MPDWAWDSRIAVFPDKPSIEDYLKTSDDEYLAQAKAFRERGVNFVNGPWMFHFRFDFIERLDEITEIMRRITDACHQAGIKVYEHHSCTFIRAHTNQEYKGWNPNDSLVVDIRTGKPIILSKQYPVRVVCINNPEFKKAFKNYILDYLKKTAIDGLMHDDIHFGGQYHCGCRFCREKFQQIMGYPLPETGKFPLNNFDDPVWRDWTRFRIISTADQLKEVRAILPEDFVFFACCSDSVILEAAVHHAGYCLESFAEAANCIFVEGGGISFRNPGNWVPHNYFGAWERLYTEKKHVQAVSDFFCQPALELHYSANPAEGFFCWAMTKLFGHCLWRSDSNIYGSRKYGDEFQEWQPEYDYFNWEKEHAHLFKFPKNLHDIGVLFSVNTKINLGINPNHHGEARDGWVQSLQGAGFVVDGLIDRDLEDLKRLKHFGLIILPNAVCMSDTAVKNLKEYVRGGGNLIVTHLSSLRDESGKVRDDFALADLLGCHLEDIEHDVNYSWFMDKRFAAEPAFARLLPRFSAYTRPKVSWEGETETRSVLAWQERGGISLEEFWRPAIIHSRIGKGRVLYCVPKIGTCAYRQGLFPIWYHECYKQRHVEDIDNAGRIVNAWEHKTDEHNKAKWYFVDDSQDAYRSLIAGLVEYLLPEPKIRIHVPLGVVHNLYVNASDPMNYTKEEDWIIGLLNMAGAQYKNGQEVQPPARIIYPRLEGSVEIIISGTTVHRATLYSPDLKTPRAVQCIKLSDRTMVRFPASELSRVAFLHLIRGKKDV